MVIKDGEMLSIPPHGVVSLYTTLKSTRFSIYIPHLSILVSDTILDAVIHFMKFGGYGDLTLEEYLNRLGY